MVVAWHGETRSEKVRLSFTIICKEMPCTILGVAVRCLEYWKEGNDKLSVYFQSILSVCLKYEYVLNALGANCIISWTGVFSLSLLHWEEDQWPMATKGSCFFNQSTLTIPSTLYLYW